MGFINPSFPLNGHPYLVTLHNILHVANLQSAHRQFLPIHFKLDEKLTEIGRLFKLKLVYSIWTTSQFTSQDCQDNLFVLQIALTFSLLYKHLSQFVSSLYTRGDATYITNQKLKFTLLVISTVHQEIFCPAL